MTINSSNLKNFSTLDNNNLSPVIQEPIEEIKNYSFSILNNFSQEEINEIIENIDKDTKWIQLIKKLGGSKEFKALFYYVINSKNINKEVKKEFLEISFDKTIGVYIKFSDEEKIDLLFNYHKEIVYKGDFHGKLSRDRNTNLKRDFNPRIGKLTLEKPDYFFNKLISLNQNQFKKVVQITHLTPILYYFKHTTKENRNNELIQTFLEKVVKTIGINNINHNEKVNNICKYTARKRDKIEGLNGNLYNEINKYIPEEFEKIDMINFLSGNSKIKSVPSKEFLIDKILETPNWLKIIVNSNKDIPNLLLPVIESHKILNNAFKSNRLSDFFSYVLTIKNKNYPSRSDNGDFKDSQVFKKILTLLTKDNNSGKEYKKLKNILSNSLTLEYISIFKEFDNIDKILEDKSIDLLLKQTTTIVENTINFISINKKEDNLNFDLVPENINSNFINFIKNISVYTENYGKEKINYSKIHGGFTKGFIDKKINNYGYFACNSLDDLKVSKISFLYYNENFTSITDYILKKYKLEFNLSNLEKIENDFNQYHNTNKSNRLYIYNILKDKGFLIQLIDIFLDYFKKHHKKELNINELLTILLQSQKLQKIWPFEENMKFFEEYIPEYDYSNLIKQKGKFFHFTRDFKLFNRKIDKSVNIDRYRNKNNKKYLVENFKGVTPVKLANFFIEFNDQGGTKNNYYGQTETNFQRYIFGEDDSDKEGYSIEKRKINKIYNKINQLIVQNALDIDNYENLVESLKTTSDYSYNIKKINKHNKDNILKVLKRTNNLINHEISKLFITGNRKEEIFDIDKGIYLFKKATGIKLREKDFEDSMITQVLESILTKDKLDFKADIFKSFSKKDNGESWQIEDIKKGGFLYEILHKDNISFALIKNCNYSLEKLKDFYNHKINLEIFDNNLNNIVENKKGVFFGYFSEFLKSKGIEAKHVEDNYEYGDFGEEKLIEDKRNDFPITEENFLDYMEEDDSLLSLRFDRGFNNESIIPWTKKWFLEKPERKEYLKIEHIKTLKEYGSLIGLGILGEDFTKYIDEDNIGINESFENYKKDFGLDIKVFADYDKDGNFRFRQDNLDLCESISLLSKNIKSKKNHENRFELLKTANKVFEKNKVSTLDKQNFYDKINNYPNNILDLVLKLVTILSKKGFSYSKINILQLIYNEYLFNKNIRKKDKETPNSLEKNIEGLIKEITEDKTKELSILKKYNQIFLDNLKRDFKSALGIKKVPDMLDEKATKTIINHVTFLSNLNNSDNYKQEILKLFLALKVNNLWDNFKKGEGINIEELLETDDFWYINDYISNKKEKDFILKDFSKENVKNIVKTDHNLFIGNIETISDTLLNINSNSKALTDLDIYNDKQQTILSYLNTYNKLLGSALANQFMNLERNQEIKTEYIELLEKLKKDLKIENWNKENIFETQAILKEISPMIKFYNFIDDYHIEKKINDFDEFKKPNKELIEIFGKVGENFSTNSNVLSISSDIHYLEKILHLSEKVTDKEKEIAQVYLNSIKENIDFLENILKEIQEKFKQLSNNFSNTNNEIFKDRIEELSKNIFKLRKSNNIISTISSDFDIIIPNIRECLSCLREECNNDTNLSFGDTNRFFISTCIEGSEKTISDQVTYIFKTNKGYNFVLDTLYGDRAFDISLSHISLLVKKIKNINNDIGIFIPSTVLDGKAFIDRVKGELENEELIFENVDNMEIDLHESASGDIYQEFYKGDTVFNDNIVRKTGEIKSSGVLIKKK